MRPKTLTRLALAVLFGSIPIMTSCSSTPPGCPVCGTDKNATVGLIDVMSVPGHSASGAPGGPFNLFDISWVDPANRLYYVADTVGVDVPVFNTVSNIALAAIGGDTSIAESGVNASPCFQDSTGNQVIPPITSAQGNYVEFGCKTGTFRLPSVLGPPNGHFGGFVGGGVLRLSRQQFVSFAGTGWRRNYVQWKVLVCRKWRFGCGGV